MDLPATLDPVPLVRSEADSAIRVAGTRVTLDTVVGAFRRGATPEEISQDFPVSLHETYAVIAYYLSHRQDVEEYIALRAREHEALRREIEAAPESGEFRARLLARVHQARVGAA